MDVEWVRNPNGMAENWERVSFGEKKARVKTLARNSSGGGPAFLGEISGCWADGPVGHDGQPGEREKQVTGKCSAKNAA